jgi:hypothetical protein
MELYLQFHILQGVMLHSVQGQPNLHAHQYEEWVKGLEVASDILMDKQRLQPGPRQPCFHSGTVFHTGSLLNMQTNTQDLIFH